LESRGKEVSIAPSIVDDQRPRLPRGVRLKFDEARNEWLLLAPERVIKANSVAVEILKRCDGAHTVQTLVDELASVYNADRLQVQADVHRLLLELATKRLLDL
jgi:pyrroloquinoline quinone biosynthesis protein D